jgi:glucose/arabinose dehydrogenase
MLNRAAVLCCLTAPALLAGCSSVQVVKSSAAATSPPVSAVPTPTNPSAPRTPTPTPGVTLAVFAGKWLGHTRTLTIDPSGRALESIYVGCCDHQVDLTLQLSNPQGLPNNATATATVRNVRVYNPKDFTASQPPPRVGQTGQLTLKSGVITEPLTKTNYCTPAAGRTGTCGA